MIKCTTCNALNNVSKCKEDLSLDVQFTYEEKERSATIFLSGIQDVIGIKGKAIDDSSRKILSLDNLEIVFDTATNIITSITKKEEKSEEA